MSDDFRRETFDIIQQLTGDKNVVVIPRLFVKLLEGDYTAAAILNQIVYWTDHTKDPDGWFYKTYEEWTEETGLSKYQVYRACNGDKRNKHAKRTLTTIGVETKVRKTPKGAPTMHYRINREVFISALVAVVKGKVNVVDYPKVNNVDERESTNSTMESQQSERSSFTETTAETTHIEEKEIAPANAVADTSLSDSQVDTASPSKKRKTPHEPEFDALAVANGHDPEVLKLNKTAASNYWSVASDLHKSKFPVERIPALFDYCKAKARHEGWSGLSVNVLGKYAPDFVRDNGVYTPPTANGSAPRPSPAAPPRAPSPGAPNARPVPRAQPRTEPEKTA